MILATLCYIKNEGKTLMLHRTKKKNDIHQGKWVGLGGKFEQGETPEACVIREVKEESGLTIVNPRLCGVIVFSALKGKDWLVFVFTARDFNGNIIDSPEGHLQWFPDEELLSLDIWEDDRIFLPWLDQDKVFSAKFLNKNDRYVSHTVRFY